MDLLLSSGFLAFARHLGVVEALQERGLEIDAVVGTSSGALVGALVLAGHSTEAIAAELSSGSPLSRLSPSLTPWRGLLSMSRLERRLEALLPAHIQDLPRPLGVGVTGEDGRFRLLTSGPLPAAVTASCAMPVLFSPVRVNGERCFDGGARDRLGVEAWRRWRPGRPAVAHWVERSAGRDVAFDPAGLHLIRTPRSGARLWSLGDFEGQQGEARALARAALAELDARVNGRAPSRARGALD
jgi:predicted acylesterase/phospholipase RssA